LFRCAAVDHQSEMVCGCGDNYQGRVEVMTPNLMLCILASRLYPSSSIL
jgi:hypothetical protein